MENETEDECRVWAYMTSREFQSLVCDDGDDVESMPYATLEDVREAVYGEYESWEIEPNLLSPRSTRSVQGQGGYDNFDFEQTLVLAFP